VQTQREQPQVLYFVLVQTPCAEKDKPLLLLLLLLRLTLPLAPLRINSLSTTSSMPCGAHTQFAAQVTNIFE
jgi:hypothetical protein